MYKKITALLIAAIMPIFAVDQVEIPSISSDNKIRPCWDDNSKCHGSKGSRGARGPRGRTGRQGPAGVNDGFVIPYASGNLFAMTVLEDGTPGLGGTIGFGNANSEVPIVGGVIDMFELLNLAYVMPRNGNITSIAAQYTIASDAIISTEITITAQLYASTDFSDLFSPIPGAIVTLGPPLTGNLAETVQTYGIVSNLNIPVTAQTRLLLVFSASQTGQPPELLEFVGTASAGVSIK